MQNTVSFKVAGSELSAYIDQIQKKSDNLTNSAIKAAIDQSSKGKEVLSVINDQIKAVEKKNRIESQAVRSLSLEQREVDLRKNKDTYENRRNQVANDPKLNDKEKNENIRAITGSEKATEEKIKNDYRENLVVAKESERQSKIQTTLSRENIETLKTTAKDNVKAIFNGDLKLADVIKSASTDEQKLVAKLTEEGVNEEKKRQDKESPGGGKGLFSSLLAVDNLNKILSSAGQLASSQNGFDMIKPTASMAGRIIGGILGGVIGSFVEPGGGTFAGATLGSSLGGQIGETSGELLQRSAIAKQDFYRAKGRYSAVTGREELPNVSDTSNVGVNITDFLKLQTDYALKRGDSLNAGKTAKDALYADKGYGVDQGTSGMLVELQRSSKGNNRDLADLIGGVLQKGEGSIFKGGDHTFLNEFLGKFGGLQRELLKSQSNVASGTTMDILTKFNRLGGEFDTRDSRSMGNISAIQNALANPGSDNLKALSFGVLRKMMPGASIFDILKEREKGLSSPSYLKGMLGAIDQIGGDDSQKQLNLSGMFPGLSKSAISRIFKNKDSLLSNMSIEELRSKYKGDFQSRAEDNTPDIDKNTAKISNSLLSDGYATIEALSDAFQTAIESSLSGAVIQMANGTISFPSKASIIQANVTKKAGQEAERQQKLHSTPQPSSFDSKGFIHTGNQAHK